MATEPKKNTVRLIYNPHAGKKRKMFKVGETVTLEDIKGLLEQYQILVDYAPTKSAGHATILAQESVKEGYQTILAAGGDGTVGEVANGLVGSDTTMGIIPMGSFMNIAHMLSVPKDVEKAIALIKIGRTRKIDMGSITKMDGEKLSNPYYFIETAGIGLDAEVQKEVKLFEKGDLTSIWRILRILSNFYANTVTIKTDTEEELTTKASLITIANGPYTGANLRLAPKAKLNDHLLTITLYRMSKMDLASTLFNMKFRGKIDNRRLKTIQTTSIKVTSKKDLLLHADASLFGTTPVELKIVPNALNVIYGFPKPDQDTSLKSRTLLDP